MKPIRRLPDIGDPSDVIQYFAGFNLNILCCRYWWLKHWEFSELAFPYWRIYYNPTPGASITFNETKFELNPNRILMIPPNTSFSTRLFDYKIPINKYVFEGERIDDTAIAEKYIEEGRILHLFIHFNLGSPYDNIKPGIFSFELTDHLKEKLQAITQYLSKDHIHFEFHSVITLQSLISDLLTAIPEKKWDLASKDVRILDTMNFIENHIAENLANQTLAQNIQLATNAFIRLFTGELGVSPQRFVKKKRIDRACILLHHSVKSIDEIAVETGFADRYHFSRVFKEITGISPAYYRKSFRMK